MKTKDFIKMLQEEDPSGEGHIRLLGDGVPVFAESKPGYYDGAYTYIDGDGNYVSSIEGYKIDIYTKDTYGFIEDHVDIHDPDNLDKIKSKFRFEFGPYSDSKQRQEKIDSRVESIEKSYKEIYDIDFKFYKRSMDEMIENAKRGWTWFQNKKVDSDVSPNLHYYYTWEIYDEIGKKMPSNPHNTESILKSGLWEKLDNGVKGGYYQWVYKKNN